MLVTRPVSVHDTMLNFEHLKRVDFDSAASQPAKRMSSLPLPEKSIKYVSFHEFEITIIKYAKGHRHTMRGGYIHA